MGGSIGKVHENRYMNAYGAATPAPPAMGVCPLEPQFDVAV
jgi:hypothetical protein